VQTVVLTARNDPAPIENQDLICIADGALSMGDHDARACKRVQIPLDGLLGVLVQLAGGFIQQQDGRFVHQGACQRQTLALAAGQARAAHRALVPPQRVDLVVDVVPEACEACGAAFPPSS